MKIKGGLIENISEYDLRPFAGLSVELTDIFTPDTEFQSGIDGLDYYEAADFWFGEEPVMIIRYRAYPSGSVLVAFRNACSLEQKEALLSNILGELGLPLTVVERS